jgi:hypothetical protein
MIPVSQQISSNGIKKSAKTINMTHHQGWGHTHTHTMYTTRVKQSEPASLKLSTDNTGYSAISHLLNETDDPISSFPRFLISHFLVPSGLVQGKRSNEIAAFSVVVWLANVTAGMQSAIASCIKLNCRPARGRAHDQSDTRIVSVHRSPNSPDPFSFLRAWYILIAHALSITRDLGDCICLGYLPRILVFQYVDHRTSR